MRRLIASWLGSGLILWRIRRDHTGSGTVGAVVALPLALAVGSLWGIYGQLAAAVAMVALSLWSTAPYVTDEGDAGWIVVDEAAGMFIALIGIGVSPAALASFAVFRAADIFKWVFPGVAPAERLDGAVGVTADDIVAGLYGLAAGQAVRLLL